MLSKVITSGVLSLAIAVPGIAAAHCGAEHASGGTAAKHEKACAGHGRSCAHHDATCAAHGSHKGPAPRHHHHAKTSKAWKTVQSDPCLSAAYRRFAAKHKDAGQRREYVQRLAREGCPHPRRRAAAEGKHHKRGRTHPGHAAAERGDRQPVTQAHYDGHPRRVHEPYARRDDRGETPRYAGDDRDYRPGAEDDDDSGYEIHSPLLDMFRR